MTVILDALGDADWPAIVKNFMMNKTNRYSSATTLVSPSPNPLLYSSPYLYTYSKVGVAPALEPAAVRYSSYTFKPSDNTALFPAS